MFRNTDIPHVHTQHCFYSLRPLSGHMPFIQAKTTEACDWLQFHLTDERYVMGGGTGNSGAGTERASPAS